MRVLNQNKRIVSAVSHLDGGLEVSRACCGLNHSLKAFLFRWLSNSSYPPVIKKRLNF
jgi:hypothetical protein